MSSDVLPVYGYLVEQNYWTEHTRQQEPGCRFFHYYPPPGTPESPGLARTVTALYSQQAVLARIDELEARVRHWKSNHDNMVAKAALLLQRPDLPVDRLPAYRELERLQSQKGWRDAVTDACVIAFIGWDEADPRKTLGALIDWHVMVALDPAVSDAAQALIERGANHSEEVRAMVAQADAPGEPT